MTRIVRFVKGWFGLRSLHESVVRIAILLLLEGCGGVTHTLHPALSPPSTDRNEVAKLLENPLYSNAEAVILDEEIRVEIAEDGTFRTTRKVEEYIGRAREGSFSIPIPYAQEHQRIVSFQGQTVSPEGKTIPWDRDAVVDLALLNATYYEDSRVRTYFLYGITNGAIVHYRYEIDSDSLFFWEGYDFRGEVPKVRAKYVLRVPPGFSFRIRNVGHPPTPSKREISWRGKDWIEYRWEGHDIPARTLETGSEVVAWVTDRLEFAPREFSLFGTTVRLDTWDDIARWYRQIAKGRERLSPEMAGIVDRTIAGAKDRKEKVRRLFDLVRHNVNYVAIELGIGGFQPRPAAWTWENRHGDCKDQATLLIGSLHHAGIPAYPALVRNRLADVERIDENFPTIAFNHMIVAVPPEAFDSGEGKG
ncbi:MAG: DUF3857 domain-containing protein, partial [Deltaproteobacteria bacterium]